MRTTLALALAAVVLGACTHPMMHHGGYEMHMRGGPERPPHPCEVNVYVRERTGYVVIDNEPVHPKGCDGARVTWRVRTDGYRFDSARGIEIDKAKPLKADCRHEGATSTCTFPRDAQGMFKYWIHLQGKEGSRSLDPTVIMD